MLRLSRVVMLICGVGVVGRILWRNKSLVVYLLLKLVMLCWFRRVMWMLWVLVLMCCVVFVGF